MFVIVIIKAEPQITRTANLHNTPALQRARPMGHWHALIRSKIQKKRVVICKRDANEVRCIKRGL